MDGKDMRCWIHHHNTMSDLWSTTDMENMKTLTVSGSWFVSIVTNNKLEMRAAFYSNQDPMPVFVDQFQPEMPHTRDRVSIIRTIIKEVNLGTCQDPLTREQEPKIC